MTGAAAEGTPRTLAECVAGPVTIGIPVREFDKALEFHRAWLAREPDLLPQPGMAEWKVSDGCYLQFYASEDAGGHAVIRLGVDDIELARAAAVDVGIDVGDIEDIGGFLRFAEFEDLEGNRFSLIQEVGSS